MPDHPRAGGASVNIELKPQTPFDKVLASESRPFTDTPAQALWRQGELVLANLRRQLATRRAMEAQGMRGLSLVERTQLKERARKSAEIFFQLARARGEKGWRNPRLPGD